MVDLARSHTTVSVERAVLRLAGVTGADPDGIPWVNRLVDAVAPTSGWGTGWRCRCSHALRREGDATDLTLLAQKAAAGSVRFGVPTGQGRDRGPAGGAHGRPARASRRIDRRRAERDRLVKRHGDPPQRPWIYLIVATGDIYEDIPQAQAAARAGADVIAVIRSTGQSLLDYVPEGATREGFAGTYATQENFRLMRAALDESSKELGRYVRLTNYASGLCMPEIAALAGLERLDMMLNDSMYGILFRDINPIRTFVDQRFSRQVHARAGIIINTGEDNYLTTADAVDAAHTVTVSQLLNEYFAHEAGLADWQLGLGHAFEINPDVPESFRLELAHALLARELFPDAPLKWMPPTKHMTGDVFRGNLLDGFFNLVGRADRAGHPAGRHDDRGGGDAVAVRPRHRAAERALRAGRGRRACTRTSCRRRAGSSSSARNQVLGEAVDLLERIGDDSAARRDRRRHVRDHEAARRPRQGPRRRRRARATATATRPPRCWRRRMTERRSCGPYGDTTGDGMVQVSFTLPVPHDKRAEGAALQLADKMGMDPAMVVHAKPMGDGFTFFVVYGRVNHLVDLAKVAGGRAGLPAAVAPRRSTPMVKQRLRRKLSVVGACIGTDAHTVGIDAILNVKGIAGEKGLEYYRELRVVNLGAQVTVPELVERGAGGEGRRGAGRRRWSPSATRTCTTPGRCRRRSGRRCRPTGGRCWSSAGPRFDETDGRRARRGPDLRPGHHAAARWPATWCTPWSRRRRAA